MEPRAPSGLFPSGPPRPIFREPHPVRLSAVFTGAGGAGAWMLFVGLLGTSVRGYAWLSIAAALVAWAYASVMVRFGDRGVAVGIAIATSVGVSVAAIITVVAWVTSGWPLW